MTRAEKTAQEIRELGGQAVAMETDIADESSSMAVADRRIAQAPGARSR